MGLFCTSLIFLELLIGHEYFPSEHKYDAVKRWPFYFLHWAFTPQTKASANHNGCKEQTSWTMDESQSKSQHNITTSMWLFHSLWKVAATRLSVLMPHGRETVSVSVCCRWGGGGLETPPWNDFLQVGMSENADDYKGDYVWIFSVRSLGYMLNNNHFVTFVISSQGHLIKFDALLMLLIGSLEFARLPLTLPGLNIWKWLPVKKIFVRDLER